MKICKGCGEEKDQSEFYVNRYSKITGEALFDSKCKECRKQGQKIRCGAHRVDKDMRPRIKWGTQELADAHELLNQMSGIKACKVLNEKHQNDRSPGTLRNLAIMQRKTLVENFTNQIKVLLGSEGAEFLMTSITTFTPQQIVEHLQARHCPDVDSSTIEMMIITAKLALRKYMPVQE